MTTQREMMPYNYRTFSGAVMTRRDVDRYNYIQGRINAALAASLPVPEILLNESHQIIASYINGGGV